MRISSGSTSGEKDLKVSLTKDELYEGFLEHAIRGGLIPPEGSTPCLMLNDCNNTEDKEEYVFRVWNTTTGEYACAIYSETEGNQIMVDLAAKKMQLPTNIGHISIVGFESEGSGYLEDDGVTVYISETVSQ